MYDYNMSALKEILDECERVCEVSRIQFDLYLTFRQHVRYFPELDDLTIHIIPKKDETLNHIKSTLMNRMKPDNKIKHDELCIGLDEEVVESAVDDNNFILFLKIDDVPEGIVMGKIHDNTRKSMFYIDILCSNPIKYGGIGKHLLDFFKYVILSNWNGQLPCPIHFSMQLQSVDSENTIKFYEKNGMINIEENIDGTESDIYPYIWKLSFEDWSEDLLDYKINEGITWFDPASFPARRKRIDESESGIPSNTMGRDLLFGRGKNRKSYRKTKPNHRKSYRKVLTKRKV